MERVENREGSEHHSTRARGARPVYVEHEDVLRVHSMLSKVGNPNDLTPKDRAFVMRTARQRVEEVCRVRAEQFARDRLQPLVDDKRAGEKELVVAPPYTEERLLLPQVYELPLQTLEDLRLMPGSVLVTLPWTKGSPQPELTTQTVPPNPYRFVSNAALGSVSNGWGELSLGVGAGFDPNSFGDFEYPTSSVLFFHAAQVGADLFLLWGFPWPASDRALRIDVTVNVTGWLSGTSPAFLSPNGRDGVSGVMADATLWIGGPTDAPPNQQMSVMRFIDEARRRDGGGVGYEYRTFPLSSTILLRPGATWVAVGLSVVLYALYIEGESGTGFAAIDLIREFGPALYYHPFAPTKGPLRVSPPQLVFTWT